jgi:hypothetical protein
LHKSPPSTKRPESAVYPASSQRQAMYPASDNHSSDAIQNPGAKGSGEQSYNSGGGAGKKMYG